MPGFSAVSNLVVKPALRSVVPFRDYSEGLLCAGFEDHVSLDHNHIHPTDFNVSILIAGHPTT